MLKPKASHAERWFNCPGSVAAAKGVNTTKSDAAIEGDEAHDLACKILTSYRDKGSIYAPLDVDDEMKEAVDVYVTEVLKTAQKFGGMSKLMIEHDVQISLIDPELHGVVDCWVFDESRNELYIYDFKYGRRLVRHSNNKQMIAYASGVIEMLGVDYNCVRVNLIIVQPRCYHMLGPVRTWSLYGSDLKPHVDALHDAYHLAKQGISTRKAGAHCVYCPAASKCTTLITSAYNAVDYLDKFAYNHDHSPQSMAVVISNLREGSKRIETVLNALEAEALELAKEGKPIPGYGLGSGRGSTVWTIENDQVIAIGEMFGVDLRSEKPKTPKQAEKLIDGDVIKDYTKKRDGKAVLIEQEETLAHLVFKPNN